MLQAPHDYREYLRTVLRERMAKNPNYSLRAFARQVDISPSHLSRVLNGEKTLSAQAALKISAALRLSEEETHDLLLLVQASQTPELQPEKIGRRLMRKAQAALKRSLDLEVFRIISDWFVLPILQFIKTPTFKNDIPWIARRFGIPASDVRTALERLANAGLIKIEDNKITVIEDRDLETSDDVSNAAVRVHHEQMANKAVEAIQQHGINEREFQALHLVFDRAQMPKAKQMIRNFANQFETEFSNHGNDIYQLNIHFFSLTKPERKGGSK